MPENDDALPRILLVEGDEEQAKLESTILSAAGFQLKRVPTCREALEIIGREQFDLVLMNLDEGGDPNGMDTCRQIKGNPALAWMPVMFATQTINKETVDKVFGAGADEFIGKPFHADELLVRTKALARKGREERWLVERARKLAEKIAERDDELDDLRRFAQDIVSSLSSALLVLDSEETILFANAPFLGALHADRRSVVGRKLAEFVSDEASHTGGLNRLSQAIQHTINSGQSSRLQRFKGLLKAAPEGMSDITVTAIDYGGARHVLVVGEDVTEEALAEAEVAKERAKLHDVVNAMNAALCLIDRDCKVLWQNRTFGLWFGDSFGQPGLQAFVSKLKSDSTSNLTFQFPNPTVLPCDLPSASLSKNTN